MSGYLDLADDLDAPFPIFLMLSHSGRMANRQSCQFCIALSLTFNLRYKSQLLGNSTIASLLGWVSSQQCGIVLPSNFESMYTSTHTSHSRRFWGFPCTEVQQVIEDVAIRGSRQWQQNESPECSYHGTAHCYEASPPSALAARRAFFAALAAAAFAFFASAFATYINHL